LGASGLGAHVALVALSVFVAYVWVLGLKVVESRSFFLHQHSVLSSVRLFKVAMVAALLLVRVARPKLELRHTKVRAMGLIGLELQSFFFLFLWAGADKSEDA
jgi:hypothetical protein